MRWSFQTAWSVFFDSSSSKPFHTLREHLKCRQNAVLATTLFFAHDGEVRRPWPMTSATAHPVCSALSGPCRPGSKQGKVSVMYCIQELLSDHADVTCSISRCRFQDIVGPFVESVFFSTLFPQSFFFFTSIQWKGMWFEGETCRVDSSDGIQRLINRGAAASSECMMTMVRIVSMPQLLSCFQLPLCMQP